jgi:prevent-host-death family protein
MDGIVIQLTDIASLTDFKRNSNEAIKRLKETGQPQVLTVNGRAEVVVQDVASYQRLLELAERAEAIEGIRRGLESAARGEGRPAEEIYAELRAKYGFSREP